jgi:hypothetical protein
LADGFDEQAAALHDLCLTSLLLFRHDWPPFCSTVVIVKVENCWPVVSQAVALHAPQSDQDPKQSTFVLVEQAAALQACCLTSPALFEQATPPFAASVCMLKVVYCWPVVPQVVALHAPQLDQVPTQLTAQACALQG